MLQLNCSQCTQCINAATQCILYIISIHHLNTSIAANDRCLILTVAVPYADLQITMVSLTHCSFSICYK